MTHSLPNQPAVQTVIVGVDTHKHQHVAVAIDRRGIRLGDHSFDADSAGYRALLAWAEGQGGIEAFGIEGTGGYGVGLSRTVRRAGHRVVEVNRADRRLRRAVVVRMRYHQPTLDYVRRRTAEGRTKRDIIRCLKRFLAREIYQRVMTDVRERDQVMEAT